MFAVSQLRDKRSSAASACALILAGALTISCSGVPRPFGSATRVSTAVAARSAVSSPTSPTPSASGEATVAVAVGFTPPQRGPGAVLTFDPKTAPVVPKGIAVDSYIASYYRALIDRKWERAFRMVPKSRPAETLAGFRTLQYGYEVKSFTIMGRTSGTGIRVLVLHVTPDNGVWNTTWEFVRTRRGVVVKDLTYARPGGAGCH